MFLLNVKDVINDDDYIYTCSNIQELRSDLYYTLKKIKQVTEFDYSIAKIVNKVIRFNSFRLYNSLNYCLLSINVRFK